MKIGVVSDTHSKRLPRQMKKDFAGVDVIFHVGDFCDPDTCRQLAEIKPVKGVCGNMDDEQIIRQFPRREIVSCGHRRIGLCHGEGAPGTILERVRQEFKKDKVDAVIFGHSHQPFNEKIEGVLYFNPGSPTDMIFAPYRSYGILEVTDEGIQGKIIKVED